MGDLSPARPEARAPYLGVERAKLLGRIFQKVQLATHLRLAQLGHRLSTLQPGLTLSAPQCLDFWSNPSDGDRLSGAVGTPCSLGDGLFPLSTTRKYYVMSSFTVGVPTPM